MDRDFFNPYTHGFVRLAACVPSVRVGDPTHNAEKILDLARAAHDSKALLAVFPELALSAYSNEDLFFQDALLRSVLRGLEAILRGTASWDMVLAVGAPLSIRDRLFNCAVVLCGGRILGVAVKSFLPNYREFYELRQFRPASDLPEATLDLLGQRDVPVGTDLLFEAEGIPGFRLFCEICEDLWAPIPPSSRAALSGATVLANLSASNVTTGKAEYRQALIANQSARCIAAYVYAAAGPGESTTDLAWDGHSLIHENGEMLAESRRFSWDPQVVLADVDLERLGKDRTIMTTFREQPGLPERPFRRVRFPLSPPGGRVRLIRPVPRFPYVPTATETRERRCREIYDIQVQGLAKRMKATGTENLVIGVSGGLDSTQALIVCARTLDLLGLPRRHIRACTMPGFATSARTAANAKRLMAALGAEASEIDIRPGCMQMLRDIGHPFAEGTPLYDVTFENVQAGQRTATLFRLANRERGLVVGTGDLSELALGWCTYGVGDHMSHYNVNAGLPKTLIQYLLRWVASGNALGREASLVLEDILETEISPELIPGSDDRQPAQSTEAFVGPYELQDFNLYYLTRYGYRPSKVAFLAWCAWHDPDAGLWPDTPPEKRHRYAIGDIRRWLEVFLHRFFKTSQFKRTCVPNAPKVGSGGSLSPRGDYRAPSDGEDTPWMEDLADIPDDEPPVL